MFLTLRKRSDRCLARKFLATPDRTDRYSAETLDGHQHALLIVVGLLDRQALGPLSAWPWPPVNGGSAA
ncbi:MAG: hypothetical protein CVV18_00915 [Gammaproteobacteria bacterium HGW-Gammaproteobacteria-8]|nr:MAG: hypothetical protein CVV18_00915 [Gammaproteobacteria bacterium HGW-Gammaproteobacteria-8]